MRKFIMICIAVMSLAIISGCATTNTTSSQLTPHDNLTKVITTKAMARGNCHMPALSFEFDHLLTPRAAEENRYRIENIFLNKMTLCPPVNVFHIAIAEHVGAIPVSRN